MRKFAKIYLFSHIFIPISQKTALIFAGMIDIFDLIWTNVLE